MPDSTACKPTFPASQLRLVLRTVIVLQCFGVAGQFLLSPLESESQIFEFLFFEYGFTEPVAQFIDDVGIWGCLISAVLILAGGLYEFRQPSLDRTDSKRLKPTIWWLEVVSLQFIACWFLANALAYMARGEMYWEWTLAEIAVRLGTPIALTCLLIQRGSNHVRWFDIVRYVVTLTTAMTFLAHGYKATQLYGPFTDLILLTDMNCFGFEPEQKSVEIGLVAIGWADIALAAGLIITRWRGIKTYMFLWGAVTALSRITAFGLVAWPETLVRSANWGMPLALILLCSIKSNAVLTQTSPD